MKLNNEAQVHDLEEKLLHASDKDRLKLHPAVRKLADEIARDGDRVPFRLSRMNAVLDDEAFDAMFDNLPV